MIYVDSSVALARLLAEPRSTPESFWNQSLVSSRLIEYEIWTRIYSAGLEKALGDRPHKLLALIERVELVPTLLARALQPFPVPLRTLDALHLASLHYLRTGYPTIALASFDKRMIAAARALEIPVHEF